MNRCNRSSLPRFAIRFPLACFGLLLLAVSWVETGRGAGPEILPASVPNEPPAPSAGAGSKHLPIGLDTVLHLTAEKNLQINQQRAKVDEAEAKADLACKKHCPPKQHASNKVMTEENVWQQKAELARLTADTVLDAGSAYVDLLAARAGRAVAESMLNDLRDLLTRATNLAKTEPGARVEVARIHAEIEARQANLHHFDAQAAAAAAKLIYLLALDPCTVLLPVDSRLAPLDLVDAAVPLCDLITKAVTDGPGIHELEGLMAVTDDVMARGHLAWVLIYCRLAHDARHVAEAQQAEAHLAYDDLRAKLTAGVQESYEGILNGLQEIRRAGQQVNHSGEGRRLSKERLETGAFGNMPSEIVLGISQVLVSLQSLGNAQVNYLNAIRDYNKAQLRLLIYTTPSNGPGGHCPTDGPLVAPHPPIAAAAAEQLPTPREQGK